MLIGGHAVNVWLEPRFTRDIDVTVQASTGDLDRLRRAAEEVGLTLAGAASAASSVAGRFDAPLLPHECQGDVKRRCIALGYYGMNETQ